MDPLLAPLSYNATGSGTTRTHGLYDGSPALDYETNLGSCNLASELQGVDQRGIARPIGTGCDAGAFEGSVGPKPASPPVDPGTPPATTKKCKKKKKKK